MKDENKAKEHLIYELCELRKKYAELEGSQIEYTERNEDTSRINSRLKHLIHNSPAVIYAAKATGNFGAIFISSNLEKQLGYRPNEFIEKENFWSDHIHPVDKKRIFKDISKLFEKGYHSCEYRFLNKEGEYRWLHDEMKLVCDSEGTPIEILGYWIDITERKKAEEKTRKTKTQYETLVNNMPEAIYSALPDEKGTSVFMSERWGQWTGYNTDDPEIWQKSVHPDDREITVKAYLEAARLEKDYIIDYRLVHKDTGEVRWVWDHGSPSIDEKGNVVRFDGIVADITERHEFEKKLREATDYLDNIIESSLDSIIVTDSMGYLTKFNKSFLQLLGYTKEEVIGKHMADFSPIKEGSYECITGELVQINEEFFDSIKTSMSGLVEKGKIHAMSYHLRKDNKLVPVEDSIVTLRNKEGERIGAVGIIRDITERKKAEKRFIDYQNRLKSLTSQITLTEEAERRAFADCLHDQIGQQLFALKLNVETLQNYISSNDASETLNNSLKIIKQIIKDTRSLTFDLSPPILYQLGLEAALDWLSEKIHEQYGMIVTFEDDGEDKPIDDDVKIFLFRAVRELLTNVAKHAQSQKAMVSVQRDTAHIRVCVEDNGVGLTSLEKNLSSTGKGGFGLFSIKERLDHLGGQFEIESKPGCGTRAIMVAPLKDKKERLKGKQI